MQFPTKITPAQSTYLDFARAAAAMTVLFGHGATMFLDGSLLQKANFQVVGVLVFFLLSGFLISYSVFRKHSDSDYTFTDYFIDRFCRIYCAFIPALIFVWLVDIQTISLPLMASAERLAQLDWIPSIPENLNVTTWLGNLLMMQDFPVFQVLRVAGVPDNALFIDTYGSGSPFWTISIEWWLYMLFGTMAIIYFKNRTPFKLYHLPVIGFISIVPAYFAIGGTSDCLSILWILGAITSFLFIRSSGWLQNSQFYFTKRTWILSMLAVFALSVVFMMGRMVSVKLDKGYFQLGELQFSLFLTIALFSLFFLLGAINHVPRLLQKTVAFFADYSFSLYLTHFTIMTYLYVRFPGNDANTSFFWLTILASNIVAIAFWWLFERHHRKAASYLKNLVKARRQRKITPDA